MKNKEIVVCSVQTVPQYGNAKNLERIDTIMEKASNQNADIIVFPEMFLSGYVTEDFEKFSETLQGVNICNLAKLARKYNMLTVCGFLEKEGTTLPFNSACIIDSDGTILGSYRKTHLFADEEGTFSRGETIKAFDTSFGRIGIMICYDTEFPEVARLLAIDGAELILMPGANMFPYEEYHATLLRARAMENSVFVASANFIGRDEKYEFCGRSVIVDPNGQYLSYGSTDKEELLIAKIKLSEAHSEDDNVNYLLHRRKDLYQPLL